MNYGLQSDPVDKRDHLHHPHESKISHKETIAYHECLTGRIVMDKMYIEGEDPAYFVAYCLNGGEAKGEYYSTLGSARFKFEVLKQKII